MTDKPVIVTIDGPAGSGKSTVSKMLAKRIDAQFLDTGAMYRAVTVASLDAGIDLTDQNAMLEVLKSTDFDFSIVDDKTIVTVNGTDATDRIRTPQVTENARYAARAGSIRAELVEMQRQFAKKFPRIVTEGRDQGTVAFPNAQFKFFLNADVTERAKRRHLELAAKGIDVDINELADQITSRDLSDINRTDGPMIKADDAVEIDSTNLDAAGVVNKMLDYIS